MPEFIRFLFAGGIAALANALSRYALNIVLPFEVATTLAYIVGMAVAYTLMRSTVFTSKGNHSGEIFRFILVNLVGLLQVLGIALLLYRWLLPALRISWHPAEIAHITSVLSSAITSYIGHKYFSFAVRRRSPTISAV